MHCVEFNGVHKRFGATPVLANVSLRLPTGVTTAIVGESGAGKSTLLEHINGLIAPDSGEVRVFGEVVGGAGMPQFRRRIGYAVQSVGPPGLLA